MAYTYVSLVDYWDMLDRHDWYFEMSDDQSVWRAGLQRRDELRAIAKKNGSEYQELYGKFHNHYFSGDNFFGRPEKLPKPDRPQENSDG